jgi:hypothetical protein
MDIEPIVIDEDESGTGPGPGVALAINAAGKNKRTNFPTRSTTNGEATDVADQLRRVRAHISCMFCAVCHS